MKTKIFILLLVLLVCSTCTNCTFIGEQDGEIDGIKYMGNTNGNIQEWANAIEDDTWIYYSNPNDKGVLYKAKKDGSENTRLTTCQGYGLNIIGDYIYFMDGYPGYIRIVKKDGVWCKRLAFDNVDSLIATDKYLFFRKADEESKKSILYRTDLKGNNRKKLSNSVLTYSVYKDKIYYSDLNDNDALYSMNLNGENIVKLSSDKANDINPCEEWIYYSDANDDFKLYKIKNDGSAKTLISENQCWNVNIYNNKIYYRNQSDMGNIYVMNLDGLNNKN